MILSCATAIPIENAPTQMSPIVKTAFADQMSANFPIYHRQTKIDGFVSTSIHLELIQEETGTNRQHKRGKDEHVGTERPYALPGTHIQVFGDRGGREDDGAGIVNINELSAAELLRRVRVMAVSRASRR